MRKMVLFLFTFTIITVLSVTGLIMTMILNYQDRSNMNNEHATAVFEKEDKPKQDYWTKERMEEAEAFPMPTEQSDNDELKYFVDQTVKVLIALFIIFTFVWSWMNMKKIKLLEKQNTEILYKLAQLDSKFKK